MGKQVQYKTLTTFFFRVAQLVSTFLLIDLTMWLVWTSKSSNQIFVPSVIKSRVSWSEISNYIYLPCTQAKLAS